MAGACGRKESPSSSRKSRNTTKFKKCDSLNASTRGLPSFEGRHVAISQLLRFCMLCAQQQTKELSTTRIDLYQTISRTRNSSVLLRLADLASHLPSPPTLLTSTASSASSTPVPSCFKNQGKYDYDEARR